AEAADPLNPIAWFQRWFELQRMRTIDAVEIRPRFARFHIDGLDRLLQTRPGLQPVIAVECERNIERNLKLRRRARGANRFGNVIERDRAHETDASAFERLDLEAVIVLGFVGSDGAVEGVRVATRASHAADQNFGNLFLV